MSRSKAGKGRQKATGDNRVAQPVQAPDDALPAVASGIEVLSPPEAGEGRHECPSQNRPHAPREATDAPEPSAASGIPVGRWILRPYTDGWTIGRWVMSGDRRRWRDQTFYGRRAHALRALCELVERDEATDITTLGELRALVGDVHQRVCGCPGHSCPMGDDND